MSNFNTSKGKHLTIEDRILIEYGLDQCYSLKEIAEKVSKDPTTILKEIKRNRIIKSTNKRQKDVLRCTSRKKLC
ncbi:helix-turn-helix domain-containing protein [Inconstantimicrobium mannanitabidum]|uniref:Uncharacterized protein n=1 Tax=Inconstantimicrobium mannanitabidum TaxID=1604901 RepID=A0ACB5RH22_9CLOT|nr:helix-turn-helix domain-containing protein [Clostridium sp. TW13]GKX68401.1 hypothetical protein rsdtw13_36590 [Clostridium sp. TW13]